MQSIRHCGICGAKDHLRIQSGKHAKDQENTQTSAIFGANLQPTDTLFISARCLVVVKLLQYTK
jgi:hypothetical protein